MADTHENSETVRQDKPNQPRTQEDVRQQPDDYYRKQQDGAGWSGNKWGGGS